ncbi:MAG: helix-turn-helix domain-containing protein [Nitrospiraceae bacterium]|nr:helix-turn-helix domain-containing protein [Nitrospira sp.]MCB9773587.1 helix-turn-helix domain-containing protein [Nitrospiraceae bacterium]
MGNLVNASAAAEATGLNPFTVRRLGASGRIKIYRHGAAVRFDPDEIRNYMGKEGEERPTITRPRAKGPGLQK